MVFQRRLAATARAASSLVSLSSFLMVARTGLRLAAVSNSACWPLAVSARVATSSPIWRWISVARAYRAAAVEGSVTSPGGLAQAASWRARYARALHAFVQYRGLRPPPGSWLAGQGGVAVQAPGGQAGAIS